MITLQTGSARATVLPGMGAGLGGLWVGDRPVLRPWSGNVEDGHFALAMNLLAPFSNRIAGGFDVDGRHYDLEPNLPPNPLPLHGDAFQRVWEVLAVSDAQVDLNLTDGAFGPFRYDASLCYALQPDRLTVTMDLTNRADVTLPYGLGFHPWFPRAPDTRLAFAADAVWMEDAQHLPVGLSPVPIPQDWDHTTLRPLTTGWINNAFTGWDGAARIVQGTEAVSVRITTTGTDVALVYSPSGAADFLCFEPVTHPVNAHNLPGQPGLRRLRPGQGFGISMTLAW